MIFYDGDNMDTKEKYRILKQKLQNLSSDLSELNAYLDGIDEFLDNNLIIDKRNPVKDRLSDIYYDCRNTRDNIRNNIIPAINNKINS